VIEEKDVEAFCKNAAHIKLVRGRPFHVVQAGERISWGDRAKSIAQTLTFPDSLIPLYIAFLAWDEFAATHEKDGMNGAPGIAGETDQTTDTEKLTGISFKIADDLVKEASASIDEDEYAAIKSQIGEFAGEL
jgi:amyloid beta precursor protein binding protein 1